MARWNPPDDIGPNERIGRRLFDEPLLNGIVDQPSWSGIQVTHFEETRGPEVSTDRMGASGVDKRVKGYLLERANADALKTHKPRRFDGWFVVPARAILDDKRSTGLVASPILGTPPDDNIYHSHIIRPDELDAMMMALHLRHLFTTKGQFEPCGPSSTVGARSEPIDDANRYAPPSRLRRFLSALLNLLHV